MKKTLLKSFVVELIAVMALFPLGVEAQWVPTNGPSVGYVYAVVAYGTKLYAGTYGGGIFLSPDNGGVWTAANTGVTDLYINALVASDTNLFASGFSGYGVFRSIDSGVTWTRAGLSGAIFALAVNDTYLFAGGPFSDYSGNGGAYRSANNGGNWTQIISGLNCSRTGCFTMAFVVNGLQVLTCQDEGGGVFSSTDNGLHWTKKDSGITNKNVLALFKNGTNLFAGTRGGGIFRSTDSSANWTAVNSGLTNMYVFAFAARGRQVFAGTGNGVFLSSDSGANWTATTGLPANTWVHALTVLGNNLFAATDTGVWRLPLSETFVQKPQSFLTERFVFNLLSRNRSNPNATISFSLPRSSPVQLKIYNLSGHLIATLVDKPMAAGAHSVSWNTRNVAAGCYMVRMQAGATTQVKAVPLFR